MLVQQFYFCNQYKSKSLRIFHYVQLTECVHVLHMYIVRIQQGVIFFFRLYRSLLGSHQRAHIRQFATESFAFLLRKVCMTMYFTNGNIRCDLCCNRYISYLIDCLRMQLAQGANTCIYLQENLKQNAFIGLTSLAHARHSAIKIEGVFQVYQAYSIRKHMPRFLTMQKPY